jgi:hypothetical protein
MSRENPLAFIERVLWVVIKRVWFVYHSPRLIIDSRIVHTKEYVRQINNIHHYMGNHSPLHTHSYITQMYS